MSSITAHLAGKNVHGGRSGRPQVVDQEPWYALEPKSRLQPSKACTWGPLVLPQSRNLPKWHRHLVTSTQNLSLYGTSHPHHSALSLSTLTLLSCQVVLRWLGTFPGLDQKGHWVEDALMGGGCRDVFSRPFHVQLQCCSPPWRSGWEQPYFPVCWLTQHRERWKDKRLGSHPDLIRFARCQAWSSSAKTASHH